MDFDSLCVPNRPVLLAFALKLTRKNKADAEDLVQETLVRAFRAWEQFVATSEDAEACVRGWLFCILRNRFNTSCRNGTRKSGHLQMKEQVIEATYGRQEDEIAQAPASEELGQEVSDALSALDPTHRDVIERHASGQAYREIAKELGIPIGTVMSRLHRGRKVLSAILKGYAAEEYGIVKTKKRLSRARVHVDDVQAPESPEPESDGIDTVVVGDDDGELGLAQPGLDAGATG